VEDIPTGATFLYWQEAKKIAIQMLLDYERENTQCQSTEKSQ